MKIVLYKTHKNEQWSTDHTLEVEMYYDENSNESHFRVSEQGQYGTISNLSDEKDLNRALIEAAKKIQK